MDAERAAAKIVNGVLAGRAYVVLTPLAQIGMRLNGLAPTVTAALMAVGGRLLPQGPGESTSTLQGYQVREQMQTGSGRVFDSLTALGRRAAARFNQRPGPG